jgi:hypothetical protein
MKKRAALPSLEAKRPSQRRRACVNRASFVLVPAMSGSQFTAVRRGLPIELLVHGAVRTWRGRIPPVRSTCIGRRRRIADRQSMWMPTCGAAEELLGFRHWEGYKHQKTRCILRRDAPCALGTRHAPMSSPGAGGKIRPEGRNLETSQPLDRERLFQNPPIFHLTRVRECINSLGTVSQRPPA